ncbi:hypothetical protein GCM10027199_12730 [Amycolatopsis magusensis]
MSRAPDPLQPIQSANQPHRSPFATPNVQPTPAAPKPPRLKATEPRPIPEAAELAERIRTCLARDEARPLSLISAPYTPTDIDHFPTHCQRGPSKPEPVS